MDRRHALRLLAATSAAPAFLHWSADDLVAGLRVHLGRGARPGGWRPSGPYAYQVLTAEQRLTVDELTEMIIPATDTPGARQARVVEFIDLILGEWATANDRSIFMDGLADLERRAVARTGKGFMQGDPASRVALCTELDAELTAARMAGVRWRQGGRQGAEPPDHRRLFWHHVRNLTVSGYYTSEVGLTRERKWVPMPGKFDPCMPVGGR